MNKVTNFNDFRKDVEEQGAFLDLLSPEMEKIGFVKPIPKSILSRASALRAKARANIMREQAEFSDHSTFESSSVKCITSKENSSEELLEM
jgi:hypothetical protein